MDSMFVLKHSNHTILFPRHPDPESLPTFRDLLIALLKFEDSLVDVSGKPVDVSAWSEEPGEDEAVDEIYCNNDLLDVEELYDII